MNLNLVKKIKRKIINKIKFSQKLNRLFLQPLNKYKIKGNAETIEPTLYVSGKIAININFVPKINKLNQMLNSILFKYDLYVPKKVKNKIRNFSFLDKIYEYNLFLNPNKLNNYEYIINIENENELALFKSGFIESCLSLLNNGINFIYTSKNTKQKSIDKIKHKLVNLMESETSCVLENCIYDNIIINFFILSARIITPHRVEKIKKLDMNNVQIKQYFHKYLKYISNNSLNFIGEFKPDKNKNATVYFSISYEEMLNKLLNYETITFDIFDTLVTRTILNPDDIFELIDKDSDISMPEKFILIRKQAELEANKTLQKDVSLDEIYDFIKKTGKLKESDVDRLKEMEIEYELQHIIPRNDMVKLYNTLLKNNKNIDIISDMYLPKTVIEKILEKCKIKKYRNLYISNEINMRKDTGTMWDFYFKNNKEKTIHIGDNYNSDYIQVLKRKRDTIKILNGHDYLLNLNIGQGKSIEVRQQLGILYNKVIFNSPFVQKEEIENNLEKYGKEFLTPIFYSFFDWFDKHKKIKNILFISREGYYLQKIYERFCELFNRSKLDNVYFLTSRRAVTIPNCKCENDLLELAKSEYVGTLTSFFKNRYGVKIKNLSDEKIELPRDFSKIENIIKENKQLIFDNAFLEKKEYLNYINSVCKELKDNYYGIVDLGYSGTTQYYLSKLLGIKIEGYYFAITNKKTPTKLGCNIEGCFNVNSYGEIDENNPIHRKSLYLESFLSAPHGQLIRFKNNKPIFKDGTFNKKRKKDLDLIYKGIIKELKFYKSEGIEPFSVETATEHYRLVCEILSDCKGKLEKNLCFDDYYTRDGKEIIKIVSLNY